MSEERLNYYDPIEEKLNVISHAFGLVLSVIALVLLVIFASLEGSVWHIVSFSIYGASLIILYAASTFYHNSKTPKLRYRLNIFDHASIYVLIAGTYTPVSLVIIGGSLGWLIFSIVWTIAIVGIIFKSIFCF